MRSLRLRGQSLDEARERLVGTNAHQSELSVVETYAKAPRKHRLSHWSRKWKILTALLVLAVLAGVGAGGFLVFFNNNKKPMPVAIQPPVAKAQPAPVAKTVASPLTGLQVDPTLVARPVTAVMIENSP